MESLERARSRPLRALLIHRPQTTPVAALGATESGVQAGQVCSLDDVAR
jgi:hypothetical protein